MTVGCRWLTYLFSENLCLDQFCRWWEHNSCKISKMPWVTWSVFCLSWERPSVHTQPLPQLQLLEYLPCQNNITSVTSGVCVCVVVKCGYIVNVQEDVITWWALLPVAPPPVPMGQLQDHQPGTTIHQGFTPLILERLLVAEQWQGRLPVTPCSW